MKVDHLSIISSLPSLLLFLTYRFLFIYLFIYFCVEMMTKFNQELYAKIKVKENEPLSSIGQRKVKIIEKEKEKDTTEKSSSTPALD